MFVVHIAEVIAVSVDQVGTPYLCREMEMDYQVCSLQVRWFSRVKWWLGEEANRAPGSSALEVEMWWLRAL